MRLQEEICLNGYFWKPDNDKLKSPGHLRISDGGVIRIEIIGDSIGDESLSGAFLDARSPGRIIGLIENEGLATFEGCFYLEKNFSTVGIASATLGSRWAVLGVAFEHDEDILFDEMSISIDGLDQWIGLCGLQRNIGSFPKKFSISYEQPEEQILFECGEYSIRVCMQPTTGAQTRHDMSIHEGARLFISTTKAHDIYYFQEIINRITDFLSFSADHIVTISDVVATNKLITSDPTAPQQLPERMRLFYRAKNYEANTYNNKIIQFLFTYQDIRNDILNIMGSWLSFYDNIGPVMGLYFSAKSGAQKYVDGRFLSLVQALETLHRRTSAETMMSAEKFQFIVQILENACPEESREWLKLRLTYANEIALRKRVSMLIGQFKEKFGNSSSRCHLIGKITDTRNYLTHYDEQLESKAATGGELWELCQKIEAIIQLNLLKKLNFTDDQIDTVCSRNQSLSGKLQN